MSETKHTPGEWIIGTSTVTIPSPVGEQYLSVGTGDETRGICRVSRVDSIDDEDCANAVLIAAAPELLAACEAAAIALESVDSVFTLLTGERVALKRLRAAIAKAKGGAK